MKGVLLALAIGGFAQAQNLDDVVKRGETVFASTCATGYCHGSKGAAGGAPRLAARGFDQAYIAGTVARGVSGTAMPAFANTLLRPDFNAVVAYLATLNGIANPSVGDRAGASPVRAEARLSAEAARGRALFSEALRGFARCSTCHEVNGIGISVATPILQVPANAAAFRSMNTPQVSTANAGSESMPSLVVSSTKRGVVFYDLTGLPPVLRTLEPSSVKIAEGSTWKHSSVTTSYSDEESGAVLEYLRAVIRP
jgi:mono/diheme cytochrome c family protein